MNDGNYTSIIIALITLVTLLITVLGGSVVWTVKWFAKNYGGDIKAHTLAATKSASASTKLATAVDKNTEASTAQIASNDQVLTFMKNLNGKLAKATIQTVKEQNVEHQHIEQTVVETK